MTHKDKRVSGTLLSLVDESYFHYTESQEVYQAILRHMRETGTTPAYRILIEDPQVSEQSRKFLRDSQPTVTNIDEATKTARLLNKYRQIRGLEELAVQIDQTLNAKGKLDVSALLENVATGLATTRSTKSTKDSFTHFGVGNNATAMVKDLLYGEDNDEIIPTGIPEFDRRSGGIARGAMFSIAATSGAGKSTMANALAINMATMGYKVLMVPLEMSTKEMTARTMANIGDFDVTDILRKKLAAGERDLVMKRYKRWAKKVKDAGGRYTIFKPDMDMTIEEVVAATNAYDVDVMIIDYISLLKGADGDDQWRQLGSIARYAKINAESTNRVNILLCQLSEDGKIRYSRAINEHSNNAWTWAPTKEQKETGLVTIEQPKSRNSEPFPFPVRINYSRMRVEQAPQSDDLGEPGALGAPVSTDPKSEQRRKRAKEVPNLADMSD
ncbi:replicative DNA helicase [Burkholderia phage BcepSaruman]|uniref:Replicative DNA helicase n=1 Tax=Burkholderia phage BcepSaruman TaxID=2530032 RepID=A0A4D5ZDE9_9CAUD|nr:replicative DNA helicase [Burkholderia phage BcepSaruman]QBX06729.1 replicative DNA helicase [Burkholderia phage BcepSaruman]